MAQEITYIVLNILLLLFVVQMMCTNGYRISFLTGFILVSSSLYHLLFGEGRLDDYNEFSLQWFFNTYEISTVSLFFILWLFTHCVQSSFRYCLLFINLGYLIYGIVVSAQNLFGTAVYEDYYNSFGIGIGVLWMSAGYLSGTPPTLRVYDIPLQEEEYDVTDGQDV